MKKCPLCSKVIIKKDKGNMCIDCFRKEAEKIRRRLENERKNK